MTPIINENKNKPCPVCKDTMTDKHDNYLPTWSDQHDDIVCWWCAHHDFETTYLVTYVALAPIRDTWPSVTFGVTTDDTDDARVLAHENLVMLFGDDAQHFIHTTTTEENE